MLWFSSCWHCTPSTLSPGKRKKFCFQVLLPSCFFLDADICTVRRDDRVIPQILLAAEHKGWAENSDPPLAAFRFQLFWSRYLAMGQELVYRTQLMPRLFCWRLGSEFEVFCSLTRHLGWVCAIFPVPIPSATCRITWQSDKGNKTKGHCPLPYLLTCLNLHWGFLFAASNRHKLALPTLQILVPYLSKVKVYRHLLLLMASGGFLWPCFLGFLFSI